MDNILGEEDVPGLLKIVFEPISIEEIITENLFKEFSVGIRTLQNSVDITSFSNVVVGLLPEYVEVGVKIGITYNRKRQLLHIWH